MEDIYKKALEIVQKENPKISKIPELYGIDDKGYYELVWDYPGKYYHQSLGVKTDEEFIKYIANETLRNHRGKYPAK